MSQEAPHHHPPPFDVPSVEEMSALLPQYEFEKLAAYGGMGAVFKARQESLDRPVAIKILPPEFGAEKDFADRFKSEARAMAKLNHTHIVAVYDFGITTSGHLYLVMEWVEGHTLHEIIHKGCVPVRKAANLAMQLCEALAYAHNHKILHRDIKPGNIMVNEDDQVKVADFGLARPITGEAEENPYGTPDYVAPEILGKGAVDQRADIYAAGVVLYEMLTGRVPQHPRRSVSEYAPVSAKWDGLIDKATHPDPEKRFQDVRDFRAQIAMMMSQAAAAVSVVEVVEETKPKKKRGLAPLHFGILGAAAMVIIVLGVMFKGEPDKEPVPEIVATATPPPEPEKTPEPKVEVEPKKSAPVVVMPVPVPEPQKKSEAVPVPVPTVVAMTPPPVPVPVPVPEDPREALQKLEERDPELAQLVNAFGEEWAANEMIETAPEVQELTSKYIPALQRSLAGLMPEQRDHILSEISHVANQEPLSEPDPSWPSALSNLRKAYDTQFSVIQAQADAAAAQMRAAQCELVLAKAKERAAAGKAEAAKRAEVVAAELAKLKTAPSVKALKQSAAGPVVLDAPPATNAGAAR
ncbi:MAG: serine/threonine-protein kinase [Prosthecobacter sp.]|uniref:serine/threonine-protein kinase n=1 Tax=Prosthecobacter sp. TaxID=1965333 RepID=UPI0038FF7CE4